MNCRHIKQVFITRLFGLMEVDPVVFEVKYSPLLHSDSYEKSSHAPLRRRRDNRVCGERSVSRW